MTLTARFQQEVSDSESSNGIEMTFYGSSFITDHVGAIAKSADRTSETILTVDFDLKEIREYRRAWGVFRDRRPDLYRSLLSLDGTGVNRGTKP